MSTHSHGPGEQCAAHAFFAKVAALKAKLTPEERTKMEKEADQCLRQATIQLLVTQPFFGLLLCNFDRQPHWNLEFPTMATDGVRLYFDPAFVYLCTRGEHRADVCHEALHPALLHLTRRKCRNPEDWNKAIDYAANIIVIEECELPLQKWALYDQRFKGKNAEQIYKIIQEEKEQEGKKSGKGKGKKGGQKQQGPGNGDGDPDESDDSQSDGDGKGNGCPDCQKGNNGNGKGQMVFDNHMESELTEDETIDRVIRAAEQARAQGKLPASIDTLIRSLREQKVDWKKFIRGRALDIFNKKDYRHEIRSVITGPVARSMGVRSTWVPGLGSEEAKTLVVVWDTSGSVSKGLLRAFASETKGVMELADRTIVITADAAVHEVKEVSKFDDILAAVKGKGGGGTDFRPAFAKLKQMGIVDPELMIYFTDAWGTFPERKPDFPVIWALTKNHGSVPWGEQVVVTEDKDEGSEI